MIKFLDLHTLNARFETGFQQEFKKFLDSGYYVLGNNVKSFEKSYADFCGTKHCIGVSNGLDALILIFEAYKILGKLQEGDEVIVPANTYIASILGITKAGLKPVLVEPNLETFNLDSAKIDFGSSFIWTIGRNERNPRHCKTTQFVSHGRCCTSTWC